MFIHLTDVDDGSGPHTYMEGSHDIDTINRIRQDWPDGADKFDAWYFCQLRKSDDEVIRAFGRPPVTLTAPAGSRFVVDTRGIHKGQLPKESDRLICQVLYGVSPRIVRSC